MRLMGLLGFCVYLGSNLADLPLTVLPVRGKACFQMYQVYTVCLYKC